MRTRGAVLAVLAITMAMFLGQGRQPVIAAGPTYPSGALGFAQIEGYWVAAGGPVEQAATAAAITGAEATFQPGDIQQGTPYCGSGKYKTGWGLWQITCGDSQQQFCEDYEMLDPWNNAEAAVAKYLGANNSFSPWQSYYYGTYRNYLPANPPPPAQVTDPGQYLPIGGGPSGTHNTSQPGTTCGPVIPTGVTRIAASSDGSDVYFVAGDGTIEQDWYSNGWHGPTVLAGTGAGGIATSSDGSNVYFVTPAGAIEQDYYLNGSWHGPNVLGGTGAGAIATSRDGGDVYFVAADGSVEQDWYSNGWHGPTMLAGTGAGGIGGIATSSDGSDVYFVASNNAIEQDYYLNGAWHGPNVLAGAGTGAIATSGDGTDVYFVTSNGAVEQDWYSNGWHGPTVLAGTSVGGIATNSLDGSDVYFVASNRAIEQDTYVGGSWFGPAVLASSGEGAIATSSDGSNVYFVASNGAIEQDYYLNGWHGPNVLGGQV